MYFGQIVFYLPLHFDFTLLQPQEREKFPTMQLPVFAELMHKINLTKNYEVSLFEAPMPPSPNTSPLKWQRTKLQLLMRRRKGGGAGGGDDEEVEILLCETCCNMQTCE